MANDFSGDPNCVALWKFDNDANDSIGGNDLTEVNTPTYDASIKKEGTHSIDFEYDNAEYCTIDDADLDANFPGKSGTSSQSFSICGWFRLETLPSSGPDNRTLIGKYENGMRSYVVDLEDSNNKVLFKVGYNSGGSATTITFGTALQTGRWYHFGVTYDVSDNGMKLRIWDDTAGALLDSNASGTAGGNMSPAAAPLQISHSWALDNHVIDGKIDEVVIFNKVLSDADIDSIRAGTYGTGANEKTSSDAGSGVEAMPVYSAILTGAESGAGVEAFIARLLAAAEAGYGAEASEIGDGGLLKNLLASELGEGDDGLTAKIEIPTKGGGMKLWT
jgi:hypothetical protein